MRYKFDGLDAVVDTSDDSIVYDGLSERAAEIIADLMNTIEYLNEKLEERN